MSFSPTPDERRARAHSDLRMGLPVILRDGNAAVLAAAAETLAPDRLAEFLARDAHLAVTRRRPRR